MFCCSLSILDCIPSCRRQSRSLRKAEEKFSQELDIELLLMKLRDSYDLTKNMINKEYRNLLAYSKTRIIDPESSSSTGSSSDVTSSSESEDKDENSKKKTGFKQEVKLAVVRGIKLKKDKKQEIKDQIKSKKAIQKWGMLSKLKGPLVQKGKS
jgi:1-acyl-sn-glycerol-3-phosphate acyltransferase